MAQTTTNNVVLERVVQQKPTAQPQIIYVNAQPQKQEEKKQQSELQQVVGFWSVLHHPTVWHALTNILLAVRLFGDSLRQSCARVVVFSLKGKTS